MSKFMRRPVRIREINQIWWFLTILWAQNWSKSGSQMVSKIEKKCSKKGSFKDFLPQPHRKSWAAGSGESFFSAPECEDDLGVASACMPTCPLEVDFSENNSDFFGQFSPPCEKCPSRTVCRHGRRLKFMLRAVGIREIHRIWWFLTLLWPQNWSKNRSQMVSKFRKKCSKKGSFEGFLAPAPQEIMGGGIWGILFLRTRVRG